jgi:type II secretory pathway pseudopilin PulG
MSAPGKRHSVRFGNRPAPGMVAFSLVEVVLALAIFTFALVTILGLLGVALGTNKQSSDQIQAANVASLLIATRRASPTNTGPNFAAFALPNLNQGMVTNTTIVGEDGTTTTATGARYNLYYEVGTNSATGPTTANVYLLLWWPLNAKMPTNNPAAYYELTTAVSLQ